VLHRKWFGRKAARAGGRPFLFAVSLALGGLAWWWFDGQLRALGFVSGG